MSVVRPLPSRPSLEFERKEAKALLRRLRVGDPEALARAREQDPAIPSNRANVRLADAQLVLAREYGFTSWPKLVRYFGEVDRLRFISRGANSRKFVESEARGLIAEHQQRRVWTWRLLASSVPRFYGLRADDVFAMTVTEDEARLAVARTYSAPSWDALLERIDGFSRAADSHRDDWTVPPFRRAAQAIEAANLDELRRVVEAHPELIQAPDHDSYVKSNLLRTALEWEKTKGVEPLRPIVAWLSANGFDLQRELNVQLCGRMPMRMSPDAVRSLLDRGADPSWVAPNGYTVLEHALVRYWNGEAVDVIAHRTRPRKAFWIAAGLGQVDDVRRYLDATGKPTAAARRVRPDLELLSSAPMQQHPDPDDEEILLEAFVIAMFNGRAAVMEYMASRGFPVNTLTYGSPIIHFAVGNAMAPMVECLIRCGADLDLRGWRPNQSAREMARNWFESNSHDAARRRIVELCGMDPDAILAERDALPAEAPGISPNLTEALECAADDAFRLGQTDVRTHNLLFGLLRGDPTARSFFAHWSRMDVDRFARDFHDRVAPDANRLDRPKLHLHSDAQADVEAALVLATERRSGIVNPLHLLYALLRSPESGVRDLLVRYGGDPSIVTTALERGM